jgi:hypothetical protein
MAFGAGVTFDAGKGELRIEESRSAYIDEETMKPEQVWLDPALIRGRTLPSGG